MSLAWLCLLLYAPWSLSSCQCWKKQLVVAVPCAPAARTEPPLPRGSLLRRHRSSWGRRAAEEGWQGWQLACGGSPGGCPLCASTAVPNLQCCPGRHVASRHHGPRQRPLVAMQPSSFMLQHKAAGPQCVCVCVELSPGLEGFVLSQTLQVWLVQVWSKWGQTSHAQTSGSTELLDKGRKKPDEGSALPKPCTSHNPTAGSRQKGRRKKKPGRAAIRVRKLCLPPCVPALGCGDVIAQVLCC